MELGSAIGFFEDLGADRVRDVFGVVWDRSIDKDIGNVEVMGYQGLTIDFAVENKLAVIVRGLRAVSDFEYEMQLASMNRHLADDLETVFMTPSEETAFISSSLVKEIALHGGDVSPFVHESIVGALKAIQLNI